MHIWWESEYDACSIEGESMKLRDVVQLLILSAIWGASFLLISISVGSFPPAWVAMLRLFFGSAFLWAVMFARGRKLPPVRLIVVLLLVALFNNAIPFMLFPMGERFVPSNIAAVVNATTPIWALILGVVFVGRKAEGGAIPGIVLGFIGVVIVVLSHGTSGAAASRHDYLLGIAYIAIASAAYAIAAVLAKAKLVGLDPIGLATTQLSLAFVMVAPVALFGPHPTAFHAASLAAAITLGVLGSGLAYLLFYTLLDRVSPTRVVSVTYFGPVWGLFWGKLAHESIAPAAYVGVAIVIGGLVLLSRTSSPAKQKLHTPVELSEAPACD
jgi:drug/metabolite transporter (DMT)-like permease